MWWFFILLVAQLGHVLAIVGHYIISMQFFAHVLIGSCMALWLTLIVVFSSTIIDWEIK